MKTNIEIIKAKISELQQEKTILKGRLNSLPLVDTSKRNYQCTQEYRERKSIYSAINTLDGRIEKLIYDVSGVTKVLNKIVRETSKSQSTAVKGHSRHTDGKKVGPGYVQLKGASVAVKINECVKALTEAGYVITKVTQYSHHLGSGHTADLNYAKVM